MGNKISVKTFYDSYLTSATKAGLMANEWRVEFDTGLDQSLLDFYVNDIKLPNLELIEVEKKYRGRTFVAPAGFKYAGDVDMTMNCDSTMSLYSFFAGLINNISPLIQVSGTAQPSANEQFLPGAETGNVITQLDGLSFTNTTGASWAATWTPDANATVPVYIYVGPDGVGGTYSLFNAFPIEIGGIEFSNGNPDIATFSVKLAYAYFSYASQASA
jgi:hypothetical protein